MAISETHYKLLRELKQAGVLPQGGSILEIGQANWYGDCAADFAPDGADGFAIVRQLYADLMAPRRIVSIDMDPAVDAIRIDLNRAVCELHDEGAFELAINHGTAEHIFNIANVFSLMHNATACGGLMIHESPFTGWVDHGFYCLQPTLFYDVAAANGYEVVLMACEHLDSKTHFKVECREHLHQLKRQGQLADNLMLFVVFRKGAEESPFRVPMQGVYSGSVSAEVAQAWRELR